MNRIFSRSIFAASTILLTSIFSGCTEPGETTAIGAATGGVIGAGLGAIVGNQTGDPGTGLVIGAAAGAGSGAWVGNALEAQDKRIRSQEEAITRQEQTLSAQKAELEDLRRMRGDKPDYRGRLSSELQRPAAPNRLGQNQLAQRQLAPRPMIQSPQLAPPSYARAPIPGAPSQARSAPMAPLAGASRAVAPVMPPANVAPIPVPVRPAPQTDSYSSRLFGSGANDSGANDRAANDSAAGSSAPVARAVERQNAALHESNTVAAIDDSGTAPDAEEISGASALAVAPPPVGLTAECQQAETESNKAGSAQEAADKLFHYRRAIRLCPNNARYHVGLGDIYLSLNRRDDAQFEYKEALSLEPSMSTARSKLDALTSSHNDNRF